MSEASPDPPESPVVDREGSVVFKRIWRSLKILIFIFVLYYLVLPQIGGLRSAADELVVVNPILLVMGLALQGGALAAYSMMTRATLPHGAPPSGTGR